MTRVGIVGAGYVSTRHLRALKDLPSVQVVGICDLDQLKAQNLARNFGITSVFPDLASMAAAKPEVIHILTPPSSHCALTLAALAMGCHVFVEKPMADSVEECDRMIIAARESGLTLSVNHSDQFDPVVLRAKALAQSGACGDVIAVHFILTSEYPTYAGGPLPVWYRQGSYPLRDLGVHAMYLFESFLGSIKDISVRHYETGRDPFLTFDEWRVQVECERGIGYLYLSWNSRPIQNELTIHGTRGVIHVDRFLQTCEINRTLPGPRHISTVINGFGNALGRSWRVPLNLLRFFSGSLPPSPGIYRAVQEFHHALQNKTAIPVTPEEGRRAIAWLAPACHTADSEKEARVQAELTRRLAPARVLVTGAAGFLGSALVARLQAEGESIRLLLRRRTECDIPAIYGSLGQSEIVDRAVEGVDIVYHLGAAMTGNNEDFEQGTVWGTRNIIESCLRHKVKRLIYISSISVLDQAGHPDGVPVTENSPYEPFPERRGLYTQSKLRAEHMVLEAIQTRNLPAVILRPGQIFGPEARVFIPNGVVEVAGRWIVAGSGRAMLPLVYRDDVIEAIVLAATCETSLGQILNIVDTTAVDLNEYLRHCSPALRVKVWRVPVPLLMLGTVCIEMLTAAFKINFPLSRYRIRSLRPLGPFDTSRARKILGWTPSVGVRKGLRRTFGTS